MKTMLDKCAVAGDITQAIDRRGAWSCAVTVIGGTENTAVKLQSADSADGEFTDFKTLISADEAEADQYKGFVLDLSGAGNFIKIVGATMATCVLGDCDHDVKKIAIKAGEIPRGATLYAWTVSGPSPIGTPQFVYTLSVPSTDMAEIDVYVSDESAEISKTTGSYTKEGSKVTISSTDYIRYDTGDLVLEAGEGGDITVEPLSVTANGTYTAPNGKAYSPVTVNVSSGGNTYTIHGSPSMSGISCYVLGEIEVGGKAVCNNNDSPNFTDFTCETITSVDDTSFRTSGGEEWYIEDLS